MSSEDQFTEDIRVRVPKGMREAFQRMKRRKLKKESELVREALLDYLAKNGETIPEIAGTSFDTPEQLHARIQQKEGEPDRVANESAKRAIGDLPGSQAKPQEPAQPPAESEGTRSRNKVVGIIRRAASAKAAHQEKPEK